MSYLVGGGDRYTSDTYRIIHFGCFERYVVRYWSVEEDVDQERSTDTITLDSESSENSVLSERSPEEQSSYANTYSNRFQRDSNVQDVTDEWLSAYRKPDDKITLYLRAGSISAINQIQDYLMRPVSEPFNSMGLYEYVGMTEKITKDNDSRRISKHKSNANGAERGRPEERRGEFLPNHPQSASHIVRKRTVWIVSVVLGNKMPRPNRSEDERLLWCRTVLTLFVPWRSPADLKSMSEDWIEAYDRMQQCIPQEHMAIINNMNVLSECKDARDKSSADRSSARNLVLHMPMRPPSPDPFSVFEDRVQPATEEVVDSSEDSDHHTEPLLEALDRGIGIRVRYALDQCYQRQNTSITSSAFGSDTITDEDKSSRLQLEHQLMRQVKRKRRAEDLPDETDDMRRDVRKRLDRPPTLRWSQLEDELATNPMSTWSMTEDPDVLKNIIQQVILEKNLLSNKEQLRAFEMVAQHVCFGGNQLQMFIGGVGGTGKSHVVNAVLRLFSLLGKSRNILVAAPTGAAAILIGGHTIHSLTLLPDSPGRNLQELFDICNGVDYLVLDEMSMIGASFLCMLSSRLQRAKGTDETVQDLPYGGVNMIFTGDFGQLRPVRESALYSHKLLKNPDLENCKNKKAVSALMGVYLWRLVKHVVLLKQNQRQAGDQLYANLLKRVRVGECINRTVCGKLSDYHILQSRLIVRLFADNPVQLLAFNNAPIIVGRKRIRDLLNLRLLDHHSRSLSATVHLYHSRDKLLGQPVNKEERDALWKLSTSTTHDSLGRLPLFPGMKVMVQENLAFMNRVVNGSEGIVRDIIYQEEDGKRYAIVVYVHIPGAGRVHPTADEDIVPIFPETSSFSWLRKLTEGIDKSVVSRTQLPLLPAYAYTDYKSQGRSLDTAIVDLSSASSLQGIYVMLSRVRSMKGLAILRPFSDRKILQRLSQELREELTRLDCLAESTAAVHSSDNERLLIN